MCAASSAGVRLARIWAFVELIGFFILGADKLEAGNAGHRP
jgi:hypothetical protein